MKEMDKGVDCKGNKWSQVEITGKIKDLRNKKYGQLMPLFPVKIVNKTHPTAWLCRCDCGNEVVVLKQNFMYGKTKSCGCLQKKKVSSIFSKDLIGQKFGKLTVEKFSGKVNSHGEKMYICKCDCGNIKEVSSGHLVSGSTKSCGCINSWYESVITAALLKNNIPFSREYSFPDLIGTKNPLRFDFCIFGENESIVCLIEFHGDQHYNENNNRGKFQREVSDEKKSVYCKNKNIPLIIFNRHNYSDEELINIIKKSDKKGEVKCYQKNKE